MKWCNESFDTEVEIQSGKLKAWIAGPGLVVITVVAIVGVVFVAVRGLDLAEKAIEQNARPVSTETEQR